MPSINSTDPGRRGSVKASIEQEVDAPAGDGPEGPAARTDHADVPEDSSGAPQGSSARWWVGVAVGVIVSLPMGWLLCYAALLPFFLGLFFFPLFGLVIGAIVHRTASAGRPYGRGMVLAGTTLLVWFGWMVSIVTEGHHVPDSLARRAIQKTRDLGGRGPAEYRVYVAEQVREHFRKHYPPGGTIGYIRWIMSSGEIAKGEIDGVGRTLREGQRKLWWSMRVVLSIGLFAFGIASQTMLLHLPKEPVAVRVAPSD